MMRAISKLAARAAGAVFVVDDRRRIVFCNEQAAHLLGRDEESVLGASCPVTVAGRDIFGNRYCGTGCAIFSILEEGTPPRPFELQTPGGRVRFAPLGIRTPRGIFVLYQLWPVEQQRVVRNEAILGALSPRERETLELLAEGLDTEGMATRLGISATTVRNHVQRLLRKLGVGSRLEAVALLYKPAPTHRQADTRRGN